MPSPPAPKYPSREQQVLSFEVTAPKVSPQPHRASKPESSLQREDVCLGPGEPLQNELHAAELFLQVVKTRRVCGIRSGHVFFRPFRSTLYSYKLHADGRARIRFHTVFRQATDEVLVQAFHLMLARKRKSKLSLERSAYDAFVRSVPACAFEMPGARPKQVRACAEPGQYRSLEESFQRVNRGYFGGALEMPDLCWSPVRAKRLLGSYDQTKNRLIISRAFDAPRMPLFVLDYLMYHELLHKHLGFGRRKDGRRNLHGKAFRQWERRYRHYHEAQEALRRM